MTSKDIAAKNFEKAKGFGGYKIDDVEDFMDRVAEYVEQLENEKLDMEKKLAVLADKLEEYRADEDSLRTALLGAQKLGDSVIKESKTKAEIILRDASIKAENSRLIDEDGLIYDVLLIDDPMKFHKQLEIYLKYTGGPEGGSEH